MFTLRLLGGLSLDSPEGRLTGPVLQQRRVAVLAMLAACGDQGCSRERLVGYIWPENQKERARHNLANAVYVLRNTLGEGAVLASGEYLRLDFDLVQTDIVAFERALQDDHLEEAVSLYGGFFLEGFYLSDAPEFERWVETERQRLFDACGGALEKLAEKAEAVGEYRRAVDWWKRAILHDPYNSRNVFRLMQALVEVGDPGNAIQHAIEHAHLLKEELEAEPAPEVLELAERLKREAGVSVDVKERRASPPEPTAAELAGEPPSRSLPARLSRPLAFYAAASFAVVVIAHIFTLQFGLPNWFFPSAVIVLLVCLPIIVATALVQGAAISARRAGAEAEGALATARRWLTWRNAVGVTVAAFAVLGLAVTGYMATRVMGIGPWGTLMAKGVLEERDLIVLAEFEDHTSDSLTLALTEIVRVDLEQSPTMRVADNAYVGRVLQRMERDPDISLTGELAREVAIREGLKAVVTGEIHGVGSSYVLSLMLVAAETGETLASFQETASDLDATIPAVNWMSRKLRERVGESLKTIRNSPPLSEARTASLEALRLYTRAHQANRRGESQRALDLINRVIEIDTTFAEAYRKRASVLNNLGMDLSQRVADATRAYQLRQRLPLWEQYAIERTYHAVVTGDREKDLAASLALLELKPDRGGTYSNLGVHYRLWRRDYARAEEMFRRRLEIDSLAGISFAHLVGVLVNQGKYSQAEETLRQWEAKTGRDAPRQRAMFTSALGDYEAATQYLAQIGNSPGNNPGNNRAKARLAQVQGKLEEAEGHFLDAMAVYEEGSRATRYLWTALELAGLPVWFLGDTARALETVAAAFEKYPLDSIDPLDRPYSGLAGLYAFAGEPERARELLVEWEAVVPRDLRRTREVERRAAWGAVALAEGSVEEALGHFRFVQERGLSPIAGLPQLGRAYELAGQPDSALGLYEQYLTTPCWGRTLGGTSAGWSRTAAGQSPELGNDAYWLPVVYERLGALYEQRGDTANAILYYGKLVDLWKEADPELQPRVEAARRAIEALSPDT